MVSTHTRIHCQGYGVNTCWSACLIDSRMVRGWRKAWNRIVTTACNEMGGGEVRDSSMFQEIKTGQSTEEVICTGGGGRMKYTQDICTWYGGGRGMMYYHVNQLISISADSYLSHLLAEILPANCTKVPGVPQLHSSANELPRLILQHRSASTF